MVTLSESSTVTSAGRFSIDAEARAASANSACPLLSNSSAIFATLMPSRARTRDSCDRSSLRSAIAPPGIGFPLIGYANDVVISRTREGDSRVREKVVVRYQVFAVEIAA
jgi:hypothetical protein